MTSKTYDPRSGEPVNGEGSVVWSIFLWMVPRTTTRVPVVADTPVNHDWNRSMFRSAAVEIDVLLDRARLRAASGQVHEIKAKGSVNGPGYYAAPYQPVLPEQQVVRVDTTDLDRVDVAKLARQVRTTLDSYS